MEDFQIVDKIFHTLPLKLILTYENFFFNKKIIEKI